MRSRHELKKESDRKKGERRRVGAKLTPPYRGRSAVRVESTVRRRRREKTQRVVTWRR